MPNMMLKIFMKNKNKSNKTERTISITIHSTHFGGRSQRLQPTIHSSSPTCDVLNKPFQYLLCRSNFFSFTIHPMDAIIYQLAASETIYISVRLRAFKDETNHFCLYFPPVSWRPLAFCLSFPPVSWRPLAFCLSFPPVSLRPLVFCLSCPPVGCC